MKKLFMLCLALLVLGSAPYRTHKFLTSGAFDIGRGGTQPVFYADFSQDPSGATITSNSSHVLTKHGAPSRVNDGTWPGGFSATEGYAHILDGAADYYDCSDTLCPFDPAGDFSVIVAFTPTTITGNDYIMGKWESTADQRGWLLERDAANVKFSVSDDGTTAAGHKTTVIKGAVEINIPSIVVVSYDYISDGGSTLSVYLNSWTVATSAIADGPPFGNTAPFEIGAADGGLNPAGIKIHYAYYLDTVALSATDAAKIHDQWHGTISSSDTVFTAVATTHPAYVMSPPGSGTEPFLLDIHPTIGQVVSFASGLGGIYDPPAITNLIHRGKFRTCTQNGNTEPDGWTVTEVAGGGASDISCDATVKAHDSNSIKFAMTGAGASGTLKSNCFAVDKTKDYYLEFWAKKASGTVDVEAFVHSYSENTCTNDEILELTISAGDVATTWAERGSPSDEGKIAVADWAATTTHGRLTLQATAGATGTFNISAPMMRGDVAFETDAVAVCDTDASCVTTDPSYYIANPLSAAGTWTVKLTYHPVVDGALADKRVLFYVPGTAGNNNRLLVWQYSDQVEFKCYDSAGVAKNATVVAAASADTEYTVYAYHTAEGQAAVCWNGTCGAEVAACHQDGKHANFYIGYSGTNYAAESYIKNVEFYRTVKKP